jgi:hypothetical protein
MRITRNTIITRYIGVALLALVGLGLQQAKAVAVDFESILNVSNLAGQPGPFGTVTVSLSGQTATITFTASGVYSFVDGSSAAVELNTDSFTEAFVSESPSNNFKQFAFDQQVDGWGKFDLAVDQKNSAVHLTSIIFTVTNTSGTTTWLTANDVLAFNEQGFDAAAHIFTPNGGGLTGFAAEGEGTHTTTPDGGTTAMLFGAGLSALGLMRRLAKS